MRKRIGSNKVLEMFQLFNSFMFRIDLEISAIYIIKAIQVA